MSQNLQPLSQVVAPSAFPQEIEFMATPIASILDNFLIVEYICQSSAEFNSLSVFMVLRTTADLSFDIPGTGFSLILNPSANGTSTDFPINVNVNFKDQGLWQEFDIVNFSNSYREVYDRLIDYFDLSEEYLIERVLTLNYADPNTMISDIISTYSASIQIQLDPDAPISQNVNEIIDAIENDGVMAGIPAYPYDVVFALHVDNQASNEKWEKLEALFKYQLNGRNAKDFILENLIPEFTASLNIKAGIEFPRNILKPLLASGEVAPGTNKFKLDFEIGQLQYNSNGGFGFNGLYEAILSPYPKAEIGNSGIKISFDKARLDLSKEVNIPEASIEGRPNDFTGVFIDVATIELPDKFTPGASANAVIRGRNLLIGTGGLSGTVGLELNSGLPVGTTPIIPIPLGVGMQLNINAFEITFKQNQIVGSEILGSFDLPSKFNVIDGNGASADIFIRAAFASNGDFLLSAYEPDGIFFEIPNVLKIKVYELSLGEVNNKFFVKVRGSLLLTAQPAGVTLMEDYVNVPGIIIWEDGSFEIEGGRIPIPFSYSLKLGPTTISITALDYGTTQRKYQGILRDYSYFGFSGGLDMSPGGVDVQGDGIKYYFTTDTGAFHHFLEMDQIEIDIHLPSHLDPKDAKININGFLSIANPQSNGSSSGDPSKEYLGGVAFLLKLKKGELSGGAAMRLRPKEPSFIVDAFMEMNRPIPLSTSGLGIYGFRGLIGHRYLPSKTEAGVNEDSSWWNYYKANPQGVSVQKFAEKEGFSVGAGIALATSEDDGYAFSSKLMLLLGLPDILLLTGQAGILQDRIKYNSPNDPPFFASMAVSSESVEVGIGAKYLVPENDGSILDIYAEAEIAYFFNNSNAWFIYVGRDYPLEKRVQAKVLRLFNSRSYLMITPSGIRAGATSGFNVSKRYGPIKVKAYAYIETKGQISFKPVQIGGSISLRAGFRVSIFKFGINLEAGAGLAAEAPQPFIISGYIYVSVKFPWPVKRKKFNIDFTWRFNNSLNSSPIPPIGLPASTSEEGIPANAVNMKTYETFPINYTPSPFNNATTPSPSSSQWNLGFGDTVIPLDSFIDIQFEKGITPSLSINNIGGHSFSTNSSFIVPPQRGVSSQVTHNFKVNRVNIKIWNRDDSEWKPYRVYEACTPIKTVIDQIGSLTPQEKQDMIDGMKDGFWQVTDGSKINKLRIACDNVFSYTQQASEGSYEVESFDVGGETILCGTPSRVSICKNWLNDSLDTVYNADTFYTYENLKVKFLGNGGIVKDTSISPINSPHGFSKGIKFIGKSSCELHFIKPVSEVSLKLEATSNNITIEFFDDENNLIFTESETPTTLSNVIQSSDSAVPFSKVLITYNGGGDNSPSTIPMTFGRRTTRYGSDGYYNGKMADVMLCNTALSSIELNTYCSDPFDPANDPTGIISRWRFDSSPPSDSVGSVTTVNTGANLGVDNWANTSIWTNSLGSKFHFGFGGSDFIEVDHDNSHDLLGTDFTMMTWMKTDSNSFGTLIDKRDHKGFHLYISNGKIAYQLMVGGRYTNRVSATSVNDDVWHHVAVTHIGLTGETKIFVDGQQKETFMDTKAVIDTGHLHLLECCYLKEEDRIFNQSIPTSNKVQKDITAMADAMNYAYQPIWRPYSKFAIHIEAEDIVNGSSSNYNFHFGFQTEGPIGHFPLGHSNYSRFSNESKKEQISIASLKHYVDYKHSFPNPKGKLVGEKPIYRSGPKLYLFFNEPYINSMFSNWDAYEDNVNVESSLETIVYDPEIEGDPGISLLPSLEIKSIDSDKSDKKILNNFKINGVSCSINIPELKSKTTSGEYVLPTLKPGKLYTAVFNSVVIQGTSSPISEEIFRYGFKTSKYLSFDEHIDSYILDPSAGSGGLAIYVRPISVPDLSLAESAFNQSLSINDPLLASHPDYFDRVIDGAMKLGSFNAVQDLEIVIIYDETNEGTGLLIRSPEPIWNPKMPLNQSPEPLSVLHFSDSTPFRVIYSKDRANIFISNENFELVDGVLQLTFQDYVYELDTSGEFVYAPSNQKVISINLQDYL